MKKLIGGSIAIVFGLFCLSAFFSGFLTFLAGTIPLILILGGCLTIYLKRESDSFECEEATGCVDNQPEENSVNKIAGDTHELIGNTGSLVFHRLDCKFAQSKNCTSGFNNREAAIQGGYKPCGICKP